MAKRLRPSILIFGLTRDFCVRSPWSSGRFHLSSRLVLVGMANQRLPAQRRSKARSTHEPNRFHASPSCEYKRSKVSHHRNCPPVPLKLKRDTLVQRAKTSQIVDASNSASAGKRRAEHYWDGGKLTIPLHQRTAVAFLLTDRSMLLVSNVPALLSGTKVSAAMQSPSLRCDTACEWWSCMCQRGATCPGWRTSVWRRLV